MPRAGFEYDGWYLWRKHEAAPWRACRHDPRTGQVDRPSLGTRDLQEAKRRLIAHAAAHPPPGLRVPADLTVAEACLRYWHEHAKEVPSREAQEIALRYVVEFLGDNLVSELTEQRQRAFVRRLRETGDKRGPAYISRVLSVLRAAVRHCHANHHVAICPKVIDVERPEHEPAVPTLRQVAAFWDAIETDHLRLFTIIVLNTGSRTEAILELRPDQVDLDRRLIRLNPSGRVQTKKRRPTLPLTDTLHAWLSQGLGDPVINWHGRSIRSIKTAWNRTLDRAGLPRALTRRSFRHFIGMELRRRRVPAWDAAGAMGHRGGNPTTELYARCDPDYLGEVVRALDELMEEIGRVAARPMVPNNPARVTNVSGPLASGRQVPEKMVGATGIEPVTPTMSTNRLRSSSRDLARTSGSLSRTRSLGKTAGCVQVAFNQALPR
jgi:integrase